ncbi:hypothetical protein [Myroides odoratimimus]|uniref:hypothetical protein n=1 Tax=Myroides odoratimimus TaxID=76832 RepID=UPI0025770FC3|nr:hypothetical protein [Myroides odoratimimus]MDM1499096.1 hypothetical protein [Myroides odoratimimus]
MSKNKKHKDFGDMPHKEIEKWQNEAPVIVMLDDAAKNDLAFYKSESTLENESEEPILLVFKNNTKSKNMSFFSKEQTQRLKQFLNENF